uniref:Uncharacterized protein n=1 Tax=Jaculus jaculus TaxID=51337 RepID=A0A8C5LE72_JACJA
TPNKATSPSLPPKPQVSFLHTKKCLTVGSRTLSKEESAEPPNRYPPIPQRNPSLPDGPSDIVYADLRKMKGAQPGLGAEMSCRSSPVLAGSSACSLGWETLRKPSGGDQNRPDGPGPALSGVKPDQGLVVSSTASGFLLPTSSEALGSRAATWRQLSHEAQSSSEVSSTDTYQLVGTADLRPVARDVADQGGLAYEQIPTCWSSVTRIPHPVVSPTYSKLSGPVDCAYESILGTSGFPEPRNTYEQIPASKAGRTHKPDKLRRLFFMDKKHKF